MELKAVHPGKGQDDGMGASGPSGARPWSTAPAPPDAQLQKLPERKGNPLHQMPEQLNILFPPLLKPPAFHLFLEALLLLFLLWKVPHTLVHTRPQASPLDAR